jgi:hypothetical protein
MPGLVEIAPQAFMQLELVNKKLRLFANLLVAETEV